jgi:hypothetical protein
LCCAHFGTGSFLEKARVDSRLFFVLKWGLDSPAAGIAEQAKNGGLSRKIPK